MKSMNKILLMIILPIVLSSCASVTDQRVIFNTNQALKTKMKESADYRASTISNPKTIYSDRIQCLSKYVNKLNELSVINKSIVGDYAFINPELGMVEYEEFKKTLAEKEKELFSQRVLYRTLELEYRELEKKTNII